MDFGIIWTLLTSRFGGWIMGGLAVLSLLAVCRYERNGWIKAEQNLATTTKGYQILDKGYVKLYQEREKITAKAAKKRGEINEGTLDDLIDLANNPGGGVRHAVPPNPPGGAKAATVIRDSTGTEFIY